MAADPIRALTGRRRTRPTSAGCRNPWQPEPGRAPLIEAHAAVQTNEATANLPAHKVVGVREAIETVGARLLYLPPYSPDFNPIEMAFAKIKALLRTAAARTVPELWAAIRDAFGRFTPRECRNYLAAAGYDTNVPT